MSTKINQGFITEASHFESLKIAFGDNVSEPKNSGVGSDFIVINDDRVVTFESKTSNTDICDAGCVSVFANGMIFGASSFLTNKHILELESVISTNIHQIIDYTKLANTETIPHSIDVSLYNDIKAGGKLVHIIDKNPLTNIVEDSLTKSKNNFVKANYIIFDTNVYCVSDRDEYDPLNLKQYGAAVLNDEHIDAVTLRTARNGSKNGKASVTMRVQYRFKKTLPITNVKLTDIQSNCCIKS